MNAITLLSKHENLLDTILEGMVNSNLGCGRQAKGGSAAFEEIRLSCRCPCAMPCYG